MKSGVEVQSEAVQVVNGVVIPNETGLTFRVGQPLPSQHVVPVVTVVSDGMEEYSASDWQELEERESGHKRKRVDDVCPPELEALLSEVAGDHSCLPPPDPNQEWWVNLTESDG